MSLQWKEEINKIINGYKLVLITSSAKSNMNCGNTLLIPEQMYVNSYNA